MQSCDIQTTEGEIRTKTSHKCIDKKDVEVYAAERLHGGTSCDDSISSDEFSSLTLDQVSIIPYFMRLYLLFSGIHITQHAK